MAGTLGEAYHRLPSEILGLSEYPRTWLIHFDFAVLSNVRTLQSRIRDREDALDPNYHKSAQKAKDLEALHGKGTDAAQLDAWLKMTAPSPKLTMTRPHFRG